MTTIEYAYRRYCIKRFPLPTERQFMDFEHRLGINLPDDFRRFVLGYNGGQFNDPSILPVTEGCPIDALRCLHGISASHPYAELGQPRLLDLLEEDDPPALLPVGGTTMGGFIILATDPEGPGEIWLKEAFGGFHFLADGIEEFFDLLRDPRPAEE